MVDALVDVDEDAGRCVRVWVYRGQRLCETPNGEVIVLKEQIFDEGVDWNPLRDRERGTDRRRGGAPIHEGYPEGGVGATLTRRWGTRRPRVSSGSRVLYVPPMDREERRQARIYRCLHEVMARLDRRSHDDPLLRAAGHVLSVALNTLKGRRLTRRQECALVAWSILQAVRRYNAPIPRGRVLEAAGATMQDYWSIHRILTRGGVPIERAPTHASAVADDEVLRMLKEGGVGCSGNLYPHISSFVEKGTAALGLPPKFSRLALDLLARILVAGRKDLCGRSPDAVAAAAIYLAANIYNYRQLSQKDAASAVGVREAALRKQYRFLLSGVTLLVHL